jgi:hypothetical protein
MYCIAYILFWLEMHVSRTCGRKICKFVRKLSKDNIKGQFVSVPLSGREADPKEPAAVFDVGQQILAYSKKLASGAVYSFPDWNVHRRFPRCGYQN